MAGTAGGDLGYHPGKNDPIDRGVIGGPAGTLHARANYCWEKDSFWKAPCVGGGLAANFLQIRDYEVQRFLLTASVGIRAMTFSMGIGPSVWTIHSSYGGTDVRFSAVAAIESGLRAFQAGKLTGMPFVQVAAAYDHDGPYSPVTAMLTAGFSFGVGFAPRRRQ